MKRPRVLKLLLAVLVSVVLLLFGSLLANSLVRTQADELLPDLGSLLKNSGQAQIEDLVGERRDQVLALMRERPEVEQLRRELLAKGYAVALSQAEVMSVTVGMRSLDVMVAPATVARRVFLPLVMKQDGTSEANLVSSPRLVSLLAEEQSTPSSGTALEGSVAYLTCMVADDGTGFFQAHVTNLDPRLAQAPDLPIIVNGMPYFYVTTLQWIDGRIVPWRYWWYDSHHHPDWYYACYRHYWEAYHHAGQAWPAWHVWAYGWSYWRFWYYWSAWFPWPSPYGP